MKKVFTLFLPLLLSIFFVGAKSASAAILNPYVVDEKPRVLFGDSIPVGTYYGLENYVQDYIGGYAHIGFTYTHHRCCFASYPPSLYVTAYDPRATTTPVVKDLYAAYHLPSIMSDPSTMTDWYLYDIQFDATGYTVVVTQATTTQIANTHKDIPGLTNSDWVALANRHPITDPINNNSMSFTPVPIKSQQIEECCSSVVFLPGIKGSVLKTGSDTIWPPDVLSDDMSQLAIDNDGESVNDIYVDGILEDFYGTDIYSPFSNYMNDIVTDGLINEWLPLPYDWRFSPEKILENGVKTADGVIDLMDKIEMLAAQSQTGQVTIVSHSMGGLLGKAIIKKLEEAGKDNLIDSFVMIGTPQLGTPQAAATLLHGDSEGIAVGFIVNSIMARKIAQNMPSAYNLLPSPHYFDEVTDPVIIFDPNATFTQLWRDFWGEDGINTYDNFSLFVTGLGVPRGKPQENLTRIPEVLRPDLLADADDFHSVYDTYAFPGHIRVVQVAGWGRSTTKAINYRNRHLLPSYETVFTREGDNTVVYPSAISSTTGEIYFFNISDFNDFSVGNTQHRDLLNANPIQNLVETVIKKEDVVDINFVSITKPTLANLDAQLLVSTHSPVILGVYDQSGNFTGINPDQNLSADILMITEDIPGSTFISSAESQYIFLLQNGIYNFVYKGIGEGPTTVEIQSFIADTATLLASYSDIPTTQTTSAVFTVNGATPENTIIEIDVNNDGEIDDVIAPDGINPSLNELIAFLKEKIKALDIKDKLKQNLLKKIGNLEKKIEKKKQRNAKVLAKLKNKINKSEMKGEINTADANSILELLGALEAQAEEVTIDAETLAELKEKIQSFDIKKNLKNDLIKRVERLENKQALVKSLSNLSKDIVKKGEKGKIDNASVQKIISLIGQIENVL